jgi:thiol-disulfide isomerase/thioredoxin
MKIKSFLADLFSGLLILVISLVIFDSTDDLLYFSLTASFLLVIVSYLRAKRTQLKPWFSFLLIHSFLMALTIFMSIEMNILILFAAIPSLLLSALAIYLSKNWQEIRAGKKYTLAIVPLITTCAFLTFSAPLVTEALLTKEMNESAPSFEFTMLNGTKINSQDLEGKVIVLNFWATWCSSCMLELPELEEVYNQYKNNSDVQFLIVNSELGGDTFDLVAQTVKAKGYKLPFAHDFKGQSYKDFAIVGTPSLVIIDKLGHIRIKHVGFLKSEKFKQNLSRYIESLLDKAANH